MISRFFWRPLAGAALVALPALALVPGCGGGGSGSGSGQVTRFTGVNFIDGSDRVSQGNLSVTFSRSTLSSQNVVGFLQVVNNEVVGPTPTPGPTATTAAPLKGRQTRALPNSYIPSIAIYQVQGTVTLPSSADAPVVNLRGAFEPRRPFTITGTFGAGQQLLLTSTFTPTDSQPVSGTLNLQVLSAPIDPSATATPTPRTTPTGTATPTATTQP